MIDLGTERTVRLAPSSRDRFWPIAAPNKGQLWVESSHPRPAAFELKWPFSPDNSTPKKVQN